MWETPPDTIVFKTEECCVRVWLCMCVAAGTICGLLLDSRLLSGLLRDHGLLDGLGGAQRALVALLLHLLGLANQQPA